MIIFVETVDNSRPGGMSFLKNSFGKLPPSKMVAFEKKKHVIPRLTRNPVSINGSGFRFFVPPKSGTRPA